MQYGIYCLSLLTIFRSRQTCTYLQIYDVEQFEIIVYVYIEGRHIVMSRNNGSLFTFFFKKKKIIMVCFITRFGVLQYEYICTLLFYHFNQWLMGLMKQCKFKHKFNEHTSIYLFSYIYYRLYSIIIFRFYLITLYFVQNI